MKFGTQLRQLHLMGDGIMENCISSYPNVGSNLITRKINAKDWDIYDKEKQLGRVWINNEQYFEGIPIKVWEYYIGGYQPAQKWLKDRAGCILNYSDIIHYLKIIAALHETKRTIRSIDKIDLE